MGLMSTLIDLFMPPDAETVVHRMHPVSEMQSQATTGQPPSNLFVVGKYVPGGNLELHKNLVLYRKADHNWVDYKTGQPINTQITHWLSASEQDKLLPSYGA